jgi:hypothetical protein
MSSQQEKRKRRFTLPADVTLPASWTDLAPIVPMPSFYLDQVMPALTDSEWRVLCVVIRQTLGWIDPENFGERKQRDWLTQSQFRIRTGKSRDSLSRALVGLLAKNLIRIENREGTLLDTPRKRQMAREHLYYSLVLPTKP